MTVFKGYLLIIKRNLAFLFIFFAVFMAICVAASSAGSDDMEQAFSAESTDIAIVDHDESQLSKGLAEALGHSNNVTFSDGDKSQLTEGLYSRAVSYVITIPAGYEEAFLAAVDSENDLPLLDTTGVPGSTAVYYLDAQISSYLNEVRLYLVGGNELSAAIDKAYDLAAADSNVTLLQESSGESAADYAAMLQYFPYLYLAVLCYITIFIMKAFQEKEIRRRMLSSAVSPTSQTLQALGAFSILYLAFWGLTLMLPLIAGSSAFYRSPFLGYYIGNTLCLLATAISIGFLCSKLVKKNDAAISGLTNIISLGMSFLCGVFVPLELLSKNLLKFSKFLPAYWYEVVNKGMAEASHMTADLLSTIRQGYLIQLCFAAGCMILALVMKPEGQCFMFQKRAV